MGSKMNLWKVRDLYLKKKNWRRSEINKENIQDSIFLMLLFFLYKTQWLDILMLLFFLIFKRNGKALIFFVKKKLRFM